MNKPSLLPLHQHLTVFLACGSVLPDAWAPVPHLIWDKSHLASPGQYSESLKSSLHVNCDHVSVAELSFSDQAVYRREAEFGA